MRLPPLALPFALLLAVLTLPALADSESDTFAQAQALFNARKYHETIALLDPYLVTHPRDARALVLRGDSKASLDDDQGALADYNVAIGIAPDYQYAYRTRCETRLALEDKEGALSDCDAAVKLDERDSRAYQDRADVYFAQAAYAEALADYDRAETLGESSAYLYGSRCDTARLASKPDRATADCAKALVLDPKSLTALWANGKLAIATARYPEAIGYWNSYIGINGERWAGAFYWRAAAFNRTGHAAQALDDLELYIAKNPDDADGYRERGFARATSGSANPDALADLTEAARLYRRDGDEEHAAALAPYVAAIKAGTALPALPKP